LIFVDLFDEMCSINITCEFVKSGATATVARFLKRMAIPTAIVAKSQINMSHCAGDDKTVEHGGSRAPTNEKKVVEVPGHQRMKRRIQGTNE